MKTMKSKEIKLTLQEFKDDCLDEIFRNLERTKTKRYSIAIDGQIAYYPEDKNEILKLRNELKNPSEISIRFYYGDSKKFNETIYKIIREKENKTQNFNGLGTIDSTMVGKTLGQILEEQNQTTTLRFKIENLQEKLERTEKEYKEKLERLEKEYKELDKINEQNEKTLEKFEKENEELKDKNKSLATTNYLQFAQVGMPILASLGIIKNEALQGLTGQSLGGVNPEEQELIEQGKWIDNTFVNVKDEFSEMLDILGDNPQLVPQVLQLLKAQQQAM